jgi:lipid-A-disaccharide synthase
MLEIIASSPVQDAKDWIEVNTVYDLMQRVEVGAVASGTATLEAACFGLPYVLVYKVNPITYAVGKSVVRLKHLGIVNILAGNQDVVTELVQGDFNPQRLAKELLALEDPARRAALLEKFAQVVSLLGEGGAYRRAADAVMESPPALTS